MPPVVVLTCVVVGLTKLPSLVNNSGPGVRVSKNDSVTQGWLADPL